MALEYIPTTFTEEEFFARVLKKTGSVGSVDAGISHLRKFNLFCMETYKTEASIFCRQLAADHRETQNPMKVMRVMQGFVDWCQEDHPTLFYKSGFNQTSQRPVKKLHNNTIGSIFSFIRKYMAQVGGIRIDDKDINMHIALPARINTDDDDAEPITYLMAKELLDQLKTHVRLVTACHGMNSTAFRWREWILTQEKNIDWTSKPPTVYLEQHKSKGKKSKGKRFMLPQAATRVKNLMTGNPENYFNLTPEESLQMQDPDISIKEKERIIRNTQRRANKAFRRACAQLDKGRAKPFYQEKYPENNRFKINLHSWRKKCGTDYANVNGEDLSHKYLRHARYLSMYTLKTEDERIEAFQKAAPLLALDEDEKLKVKLIAKDLENDKLKETQAALMELEKEKEEWKKQQKQVMKEQFAELMREHDEFKQKKSSSK